MSNAIVQAAQPQELTLAEQLQYAETVCKGSLVPKEYRDNPANVLIAMDFGRSMGLSPAESLYRITVINGRPTASAELIAANVRRAGHKLRVLKDEKAKTATCQIVRADDPDFTFEATWDMAKAQQAGLSGKDNWKKYPVQMLRARAITECAREACPEALYGVAYTGEEMEGGFGSRSDGYQVEVLDEEPAQPQQPARPQRQTPEQYQAGIQLGEWQSRAGAAMRRAKALGFQVPEIKAQAREEYGVDVADMDAAQLQAFCSELEGTIAAYEAAE